MKNYKGRLFEGKYNTAIVYNDEVEETAVEQINSLLNHSAFDTGKLYWMSDIHAGAGCCIGFTHYNPSMSVYGEFKMCIWRV